MKQVLLAAALAAAGAGPAVAQNVQPASLTRGDAHAVIGWQNLREKQPPGTSYSNDWLNAILYGGAGAGWYWTEHLKTQVDIGGGTSGRQYRYRQFSVDGSPAYETSRLRVRETNLAISQHYQFYRNAWFHPHVGAGIDIARQRTQEDYDNAIVVDNATHASRVISPAHSEDPERRTIARPFGEIGFKTYMTRRAFCAGDTRLRFRRGIDEVRFRIGFGVDF